LPKKHDDDSSSGRGSYAQPSNWETVTLPLNTSPQHLVGGTPEMFPQPDNSQSRQSDHWDAALLMLLATSRLSVFITAAMLFVKL